MANKPITAEYMEGIKEGQRLLRDIPDLSIREINSNYRNSQELARTHEGAMKSIFQGERDFWRHQLKKRGVKPS